MTCREYYRSCNIFSILADYSPLDIVSNFNLLQIRNFGIEMDFPAVFNYAIAHCLYYCRKFIAAYMRVSINKNGRVCTKFYKLIQHLADVAFFCGASIKLSVRESSGTALPKTII